MRRRLRATGISSFAEYYAFLTSPAGGGEMPLFLDAITTNETYFFRDTQHYDWLGETFLPEIVQQAVAAETAQDVLRIWSAACSTGEEPYSIALKVLAQETTSSPAGGSRSLGTDLSGAVLAAARAGSYDARAVRLVEPAERKRSSTKMPQPSAGPSSPRSRHWSPGSSTTCCLHSRKNRSTVSFSRTC